MKRMELVALLGAVASARAEVIPIINPGFEDLNVTLRPGEQTVGAGGGVIGVGTRWPTPFNPGGNVPQTGVVVPGWRTYTPAPPAIVYAGVLNPNVSVGGTPWLTGYSGNYVGALQVSAMQQTLPVTVQPSTTYTLTFLAGLGWTDSTNGVYVSMLGAPDLETLAFLGRPNVTTLSLMSGVGIDAADRGAMLPFSLTYTSPATLPADVAGRYLAISIIGSDGFPRMCYDDFALEATPVPTPSVVIPAVVPLLALCRKREPRPSRGSGAAG